MSKSCYKCKYEKYVHGVEDFKCTLNDCYLSDFEPCTDFEYKDNEGDDNECSNN